LLEAGWEILENTPFIIQRYRADTISIAYYGDTIVNSVSDTLTAVVGVLFAAWVPPTATILVAVAIEVGLAVPVRDNLVVSMSMLGHEVRWMKGWQAAGQTH